MKDSEFEPLVAPLVGRRGYPSRYPENSLVGMQAALAAGARYFRMDVQISADGVPVLYQDNSMQRLTGKSMKLAELAWAELQELELDEQTRFGDQFLGTRIASVAQVAAWLQEKTGVTVFLDIKSGCLRRWGQAEAAELVLKAVQPASGQIVILSHDVEALWHAQSYGAQQVAWAFERWDAVNQDIAERLSPHFLCCPIKYLPADYTLWPGQWRWIAHETQDPVLAAELLAQGIDLVETDAIGEMLTLMHFDREADTDEPGL
jgi:glycerophosphoryl diester phosphodiesterase